MPSTRKTESEQISAVKVSNGAWRSGIAVTYEQGHSLAPEGCPFASLDKLLQRVQTDNNLQKLLDTYAILTSTKVLNPVGSDPKFNGLSLCSVNPLTGGISIISAPEFCKLSEFNRAIVGPHSGKGPVAICMSFVTLKEGRGRALKICNLEDFNSTGFAVWLSDAGKEDLKIRSDNRDPKSRMNVQITSQNSQEYLDRTV